MKVDPMQELLERFRQAIQAWKRADDDAEQMRLAWERCSPTRPGNVKLFPDAQMGDILYAVGELCYPVGRYVVVAKTADGAVRVVHLQTESGDPVGNREPTWASTGFFTTPEAALEAECLEDIEYHEPRLDRARAVLQAVRRGKPYEHLLREPGEED